MKKKFSFAQCATVLLTCTALVSTGILLYVEHLTKSLHRETLLALQEFAFQDAKHIEMQVAEDLDLLASIATALTILPDATLEEMDKLLTAERAQNHFKNMELVDPQGISRLDDGSSLDLSQEPHFKKAILGESNISPRLVDFVDGANILVESVPIRSLQGNISGVLMGTRSTADFGKMLDMQSFNGEGYSLLVDSSGNKMVESYHKNAISGLYNIFDMPDDPDHLLRHKVIKDFAERKSGTVKYTSQKRGVLYISYQPLNINDWYLISVVPEQFITKVSRSYVTLLPLLCALISLAAFVLGGYMCYVWPMLRERLSAPDEL